MKLQGQPQLGSRIINLGLLSDNTDPSIWKGKASLAARLKNGEITQECVQEHLAKLPQFFVPVHRGAPRRCVDDRPVKGFDPTAPDSAALGPQFQGGTIEVAYTARLGKLVQACKAGAPADGLEATIADDTTDAMDCPSPFAPGDHTDDHHGPEATGCGLADTMPAKNARLAAEPALLAAVHTKTDAVLALDGRTAPQEVYQDLVAGAVELSRHPEYFASMQHAFQLIRQGSPQGMPVLSGAHLPGSVTINFVRETTFHTSAYAAATGGELYNFGFDAWAVVDEYEPQQAAMIIADAIATLSQLTDGSIHLLARLPQG